MEPLHVTMMKDFTVVYQGQQLALSQNLQPRFLQMLQIVWLSGSKGVACEDLLQDLYDNRTLSSPANSLNNLLLQARKHLRDAGLPEGRYVIHRGKRVYPDPDLPLQCDAADFSECIRKARECTEPGIREDCYREAFALYRGALLARYIERPWMVRENGRLRREYREAGRYLIQKALQNGERNRAEELARIGDSFDPEADRLHSLQREPPRKEILMDSDSDREYTGTVMKSENTPPPSSSELPALLLNRHCIPQQARIIPEQNFLDVVRVLCGGFEKIGGSVFLVLIRLLDYKGREIANQQKRTARMAALSCSIISNLHRGDVITPCGDSAYLVLMVGYDAVERSRTLRKIRVTMRNAEGTNVRLLSQELSLAELE